MRQEIAALRTNFIQSSKEVWNTVHVSFLSLHIVLSKSAAGTIARASNEAASRDTERSQQIREQQQWLRTRALKLRAKVAEAKTLLSEIRGETLTAFEESTTFLRQVSRTLSGAVAQVIRTKHANVVAAQNEEAVTAFSGFSHLRSLVSEELGDMRRDLSLISACVQRSSNIILLNEKVRGTGS